MIEPGKSKVLDVAVGVIIRNDQVLISWRNAAQHQGSRYEFPGGKIDAGESPEQGLRRELNEELGITVERSIRAQQLTFKYPEKTVRLHIFKVTGFSGEPVGQEGQPVLWVNKEDLPQYQFPDANAPILRMVYLPERYLISFELIGLELISQEVTEQQKKAKQLLLNPDQELTEIIEQWLNFHIRQVPQQAWLYVRVPQASPQDYAHIIKALAAKRPDLKLMVMYRHLAYLAENIDRASQLINGIHLSQQDLMQCHDPLILPFGLPANLYRVAACHDQASIDKANQLKLDAILLSPLHATATHQSGTSLGWLHWQQLCSGSHLPVYALGGVQPHELGQIQNHGGFGVAGIRAFYG